MFVSNRKIKEIFAIEEFVSGQISSYLYCKKHEKKYFLGWGRKPSFFKAQHYAKKYHTQCICLEDGFVRSLGLGKEGYQPLSLVADQSGIYFDATQPSDLERLVLQPITDTEKNLAHSSIKKIIESGITKYNLKYDEITQTIEQNRKNILVVDQTYGDQSISYALASTAHFKYMLQHASHHHPDATIWIKIHPDVIAGKSKTHFSSKDLKLPNVRVLEGNYNPIELCQKMSEIYVVSSQLGFEALLCGKPVHCFGLPWYAGWGLTHDHHELKHLIRNRRNIICSIDELFIAAYIKYARYVSPVTHQRCELNEIIDILAPNIAFQEKLPKVPITLYGFSKWKRKFIKDFLDFPHTKLKFRYWFKPTKDQPIIAWGKKAKILKELGYQNVWTVEDGFLRSLGLGAKLIRPFSLVFDDLGIYYDATQPSRLEFLLNQVQLNPNQKNRTQRLIQEIVQQKLTKYNVGEVVSTKSPHISLNKKVLLVIGQVEDDLSVQLGGIDIKTNEALIKEVRANNPDAYIIYKPHPDVETGLRKGKVSLNVINKYIDHIEARLSIITLFEYIDEIHTITSLSGFEALLRGIKVYCYGIPFYAGWGLTIDRHQCVRRNRKLMLEELVYSTLIEYPTYNLPHTQKMQIPLVTPEHVLEHMLDLQQMKSMQSTYLGSWIFTKLRQLKNTVLR